ncbi:MAG: hypothetical protein RIS09_917 [Actinomycetota bacterium]|jgi:hypothetical protein
MTFLRYTLLRMSILFLFLIGLSLIGLRGLVLWIVAIGLSGIASLYLLKSQRDSMSESVVNVVSKVNKKIDDSAKKEDTD